MTTTLTDALTTPASHQELFARLERNLPGPTRLRRDAMAAFGEAGFPGDRNEDWKFTNVGSLVRTPFLLPRADSEQAAAAYRRITHGDGPGATVMDVNANRPFLADGSRPLPRGVILGSLSEALQRYPDLVEKSLGRILDLRGQGFWALNAGFWRDGVFLYVPPECVIEEPIHLTHLVAAFNDNAPYLWYRRVLLVLDRGSQATVAETFGGPGIQYATNVVTEVSLAEGARLDHYKVQEESPSAFHLASLQAVVSAHANFSTHYVGFGGQLARNEVRVRFVGSGAEATVNGLYHAANKQHMDNHTVIDHTLPHCNSHELYKGILDGHAKGVFNGKIFVRQDAQKTDAKQTNQTLLLSEDATINTKPQLEIFADDVKCTHGATVGALDDEQLFYLRARGIGLDDARKLLTFAFANDIIDRIKVESVRRRLEQQWLAGSGLAGLSAIEEQ